MIDDSTIDDRRLVMEDIYIHICNTFVYDGYDMLNDCAMFEIDVLMANIDASIYLLPLLHHEIYTTNKCEDNKFKSNNKKTQNI